MFNQFQHYVFVGADIAGTLFMALMVLFAFAALGAMILFVLVLAIRKAISIIKPNMGICLQSEAYQRTHDKEHE